MASRRARPNPEQSAQEQVRASLDTLAGYSPIHAYVADKGRFIESAQLTPEELGFLNSQLVPAAKRMPATRTFQPKQCFHNSQMVAVAYKRLTSTNPQIADEFKLEYFEGFYFMSSAYFFAIHHGWCMLNGKLIDFTLTQDEYDSGVSKESDKVIGVIPQGDLYLGSELPISDVEARIQAFSATNTLLDDPERRFPYLKPYIQAMRAEAGRRSKARKASQSDTEET